MAQMTSELMGTPVTNADTMNRSFSLHRRVFVDLTNEWAQLRNSRTADVTSSQSGGGGGGISEL